MLKFIKSTQKNVKILYPFWYCTLGLCIKFFPFLQCPDKPIFTPLSLYSFPLPTLKDSASPSKRTSVSSFQSTVDSDSAASISLNVELDNVNFHIKKPSKYPHVPPHPADQKGRRQHHLHSTQAGNWALGSHTACPLPSSVPKGCRDLEWVLFHRFWFSSPRTPAHTFFWLILFISYFLPLHYHAQFKAYSLEKELYLTVLPIMCNFQGGNSLHL